MNRVSLLQRSLAIATVLSFLVGCYPPLSQPPQGANVPLETPVSGQQAGSNVSLLVQQLSDPDAGVRLRAASQLGGIRPLDSTTAQALIGSLEDPDTDVRAVVAYALGQVNGPSEDVALALVARLGDENSRVRYAAARALGSTAVVAAIPDLVNLLANDPDENVRMAAAEAMAAIGPSQAELPTLVRALMDDNWYVRRNAGLALAHLGAGMLVTSDEFQQGEWNVKVAIADVLSQMGAGAIPELAAWQSTGFGTFDERALVNTALMRMTPWSTAYYTGILEQALANGDRDIARSALSALGHLGESGVPALVTALYSIDDRYLNTVTLSLARIGPTAIPQLVDALGSGNDQASSGAVEALGMMGDAAIPQLLDLLASSDDENVRVLSILSLGRAASMSTVDPARSVSALSSTDPQARRTAIARLQESGHNHREAVLALMVALQTGSPAIQSAAAESLAQFGPTARPAIPALVTALNQGSEELRIAAAQALGLVGGHSEEVFAALAAASQDQNTPDLRANALRSLAGLGSNALPFLLEALDDDTADQVKLAAIQSLGRLGLAAYPALPELTAVLQTGQPAQRTAAASSLAAMGPAAAPELIAALLAKQDPGTLKSIRDGLASIGPAAVPGLVDLLGSGDPIAGERAARTLALIGAPAVPGLVLALRTRELSVRAAVIDVLGQIGEPAFAGFEVALQDEDQELRSNAAILATEIYTRTARGSGLAVKEAVPFLVSSLVDSDPELRVEAALTLALVGADAVEAAPALAGALADAEVRMAALTAIRAIGPGAAEATPALAHLLDDQSAAVRSLAAEALRSIGPGAGPAGRALVSALAREADANTRRKMIEALAAAGPSAPGGVSVLVDALQEPGLRRAAAEALGGADEDAAPALLAVLTADIATVPELAKALHGLDSDRRRSAAYALLRNPPATRVLADELLAILADQTVDAEVRTMIAAALEASGQDMAAFWNDTGLPSPLTRGCPNDDPKLLLGGGTPDLYMGGCRYEPPPTAPLVIDLFTKLVWKLTSR